MLVPTLHPLASAACAFSDDVGHGALYKAVTMP